MARTSSTARAAAAAGTQAEPDAAPPFWIADRSLPVGDEMGEGSAHARAFAPGDRVPDEHVQRFGWQEYVHAPEGEWPPPEPAPQPAEDAADQSGGDAGSGDE